MDDVVAESPAVERRRRPRRAKHHEAHVAWKHIAVYLPVVLVVIFLGGLALWSFIERQSLVVVPEPIPRVTLVTADAGSPLTAAWVKLLNAAAIETTVLRAESGVAADGLVARCGNGVAILGMPPPDAPVHLAATRGTSDDAIKLAETVSPVLARLSPGAELPARPAPVAFLEETPQMHVDARWRTNARAVVMHMETGGTRVLWIGLQPDAIAPNQSLLLMLRTGFRWLGGQAISDGASGDTAQAASMAPAARRRARDERLTFSFDRLRDRNKFAVRMENRGKRRIVHPTVQLWLPPGVTRVALGGDWIMRRGATLNAGQQDGVCVLSLPSLAPNEARVLKLEVH
jgi:hypothetical protein